MMFSLQPTLENDLLIIRPMQADDFDGLYKVASDPLVWAQHPAKDRYQLPVFTALFNDGLASGGAFVVIDKSTQAIIGSTRFNPVKESTNAIEIGWSYLARAYWGGVFNKAQKHLLMDYAFEYVENVLFYINQNNMRSRKAVEKLGGTLLTHLDGQLLDPRSDVGVIYKIARKDYTKI
jgi:RimJ/RimL family protein N-acetyltransferase